MLFVVSHTSAGEQACPETGDGEPKGSDRTEARDDDSRILARLAAVD
jgi:hypothetical protein